MKGRNNGKQDVFPLYNTDADSLILKHSSHETVVCEWQQWKKEIMQVLEQVIWVHWLRNSKGNKSLVALKNKTTGFNFPTAVEHLEQIRQVSIFEWRMLVWVIHTHQNVSSVLSLEGLGGSTSHSLPSTIWTNGKNSISLLL